MTCSSTHYYKEFCCIRSIKYLLTGKHNIYYEKLIVFMESTCTHYVIGELTNGVFKGICLLIFQFKE